MAFDNFWHLHYSLVLPILVALRELLRSMAERFGRRPVTPERLARGRKICGIAAAVLVVAGGLALAAIIEVSLGLQLVDILHVQFWTVTRAALGNAAVVLGLAAAIESLYWIWREFSLDSLARDWVPSPPGAGAALVRVAHLSDLHVVGERYGYRMEAGTEGPRGNQCIRSALRKLAAIYASNPLDRVLMTGDITDAGTRAEWAAFIDLLRGAPSYAGGCLWFRVTMMSTLSIVPTPGVWICRGARANRCASSASFLRSTPSGGIALMLWTTTPGAA